VAGPGFVQSFKPPPPPPYTHNIIVNNIESIKLKVTFLATNCTKILINI